MAKGAAWMVLLKILERGIGLISTVILARLLIPQDFGLIAMAMSIIAVLQLFGDVGFEVAIIQNNNAEPKHYDTAWTFNLFFGIIACITLLVLARPTALFYEEPRLAAIIYVLAIGVLIKGLANIGIVDFRKELQFDKDFKFLLARKLSGFFITVPIALIYKSYWALVLGIVGSNLFSTVLSYLVHPYRPKITLSAWNDMFHFSKWLLFSNILGFLRIRSSDFIIGKIIGPHALGLFSISYEISNLPTSELSAPINRAVFPAYAKLSHDARALRQNFLNVLSILAILVLPIGTGMAVLSGPLVLFVLGEKWIESAPLITLLAFSGIVSATQSNTASIYLAIKRPNLLTLMHGVSLLILVPLTIWLSGLYGVVGAAWAYIITAIFSLPLNYAIVFALLRIKVSMFLFYVWRPVVSTLIMYQATSNYLEYSKELFVNSPVILPLFTSVLVGAIVYCVAILAFWQLSSRPDGAEGYLIKKTIKLIRKYFPRADDE